MILLFILFIGFLTFSSAFFSASEVALFSLPSHTVRAYAKETDSRKLLVYKLLSRSRDLLVTIFILNTIVNILLQNSISALAGPTAGWLLKVGVPLLLTLVLGETVPKLLAMKNNRTLSLIVAPWIALFQTLTAPLRTFFIRVTTPLSRILFFFLKEEQTTSRDELDHMLHESLKQGILRKEEVEIINGYLDFRTVQVRELMQPREEILSFDLSHSLKELDTLFIEQQLSLIPIHRGEINRPLGILSARDYFLNRESLKQGEDLLPLLKPLLFLPETAYGPAALHILEDKEQYLALVVDEYGSITGLITWEDLVEQVVGDIEDRRDLHPDFTRLQDDVVIASGKLELDEFEKLFGVQLNSPYNRVTLGGWLTDELGEIPKTGQRLETDQFLFQVLAADPNRVRRVYIRKMGIPGAER